MVRSRLHSFAQRYLRFVCRLMRNSRRKFRVSVTSPVPATFNQGPYVEALRQGLRDLGYVEGKNFVVEYRGAEGKLNLIPNPHRRTCTTQSRYTCRPHTIGSPRGKKRRRRLFLS